MDSLATHPSTAVQARAFTSASSLSFPGGAGNHELTPPTSEKEMAQGQQPGDATNGNGVIPSSPAPTPAATPGATTGSSGIVPTLQYVYSGLVSWVTSRLTSCYLKEHRCYCQP